MGIKRSYGYCKLASLRMRVCECQGTLAGFSRGDVEGAEGAKSARGVQPTHVFLCSLCMWPDGSSRFALFVECLSVKKSIYIYIYIYTKKHLDHVYHLCTLLQAQTLIAH